MTPDTNGPVSSDPLERAPPRVGGAELSPFHPHVLQKNLLALTVRETDARVSGVERLALDAVLPVRSTITAGDIGRDQQRCQRIEHIRNAFQMVVLERDMHVISMRTAAARIRL